MRQIDADELLKDFEHCSASFDEGDFPIVVNVISQAPTIDQWHYPSKGELPTNGEEILCKLPYKGYAVGKYNATFNYFGFEDFNTTPINIECWQYIIPPKKEI